jgi:hypothetical protein
MEAENSLLTLLLWLGGEKMMELQKNELFQLGENELLVGVFDPLQFARNVQRRLRSQRKGPMPSMCRAALCPGENPDIFTVVKSLNFARIMCFELALLEQDILDGNALPVDFKVNKYFALWPDDAFLLPQFNCKSPASDFLTSGLTQRESFTICPGSKCTSILSFSGERRRPFRTSNQVYLFPVYN